MDSFSSEDDMSPLRLRKRKRRRDAGKTRLNQRDVFALTWIGQQYAIRLDQLQWLLGRYPGRGARRTNWISESSARDVVDRWETMGYVHAEILLPKDPMWIWTTRKAFVKTGLPYSYNNLEESSLGALAHLYAINAIRLRIEANTSNAYWTSERELLRGQVRTKGKIFLHRPDGVVRFADGQTVAIEAELSTKKPFELAENLVEQLRGEEYLRSKADLGWQLARTMGHLNQSEYDQIWYFAPKTIRKQIRRARAKLLADGTISQEEAERIRLLWYPLAASQEEHIQQEREDDEALDLDSEEWS